MRLLFEAMKNCSHLLLAGGLLLLPACEQKQTSTEEVKETVNDALDRRPGEEARDAAEEAGDAIEDAAEDVKDTVNEATE